MTDLKHAAVIGELGGAGKCALNTALPILAAAGVETCVVPTSVITARALDGKVYHRRDMTAAVPSLILKWKDMRLRFDAIACMLSGTGEMKAALAFSDAFMGENCLLMLEPKMDGVSDVNGMKELCGKAGLIVLDVDEAADLLGETARKGPYDRNYIEHLLYGMCSMGPGMAVIKGVWFSPELMGAASLERGNETVSYAFVPHIGEQDLYGSDDAFSATLLAGLLNGMGLTNAVQFAVNFTGDCIRMMRESGWDFRLGLIFETAIPQLVHRFEMPSR